jgi:hypothetical protein
MFGIAAAFILIAGTTAVAARIANMVQEMEQAEHRPVLCCSDSSPDANRRRQAAPMISSS